MKTEEVLNIVGNPNKIKLPVFVCLSIRNFVRNDDAQLYACLPANFIGKDQEGKKTLSRLAPSQLHHMLNYISEK